jgi:hypothetical protein
MANSRAPGETAVVVSKSANKRLNPKLLGLVLVIVLAGVIAIVLYKHYSKVNSYTNVKGIQSTITPPAGKKLNLVIPDGWAKTASFVIGKNISGTDYRIYFETTSSNNYLAAKDANASLIKSVKTSAGTMLYIVSSGGDVAVSSCQPQNGKGCLPKQSSNEYLFILLAPWQKNMRSVGAIDLNSTATKTAITDLEAIVASLNI